MYSPWGSSAFPGKPSASPSPALVWVGHPLPPNWVPGDVTPEMSLSGTEGSCWLSARVGGLHSPRSCATLGLPSSCGQREGVLRGEGVLLGEGVLRGRGGGSPVTYMLMGGSHRWWLLSSRCNEREEGSECGPGTSVLTGSGGSQRYGGGGGWCPPRGGKDSLPGGLGLGAAEQRALHQPRQTGDLLLHRLHPLPAQGEGEEPGEEPAPAPRAPLRLLLVSPMPTHPPPQPPGGTSAFPSHLVSVSLAGPGEPNPESGRSPGPGNSSGGPEELGLRGLLTGLSMKTEEQESLRKD